MFSFLQCVINVHHFILRIWASSMIRVEGSLRVYHLSLSQVIALNSFHFFFPSKLLFPLFQSFLASTLGLFVCVLACQAILMYLWAHSFTAYQNPLTYANSIISLCRIVPDHICIVWYLILSHECKPNNLKVLCLSWRQIVVLKRA